MRVYEHFGGEGAGKYRGSLTNNLCSMEVLPGTIGSRYELGATDGRNGRYGRISIVFLIHHR